MDPIADHHHRGRRRPGRRRDRDLQRPGPASACAIDEAFAQIEVQLKRRHDLIPNLVNAVKGYMGFEQKVLTDVTNARANAVAAGAQGPAQQAAAENALTSTLRSLFAVVENYPELKANQNVLELQEQLTTTENQISFSRQHYNATVLDYNTVDRDVPERAPRGPARLHEARVLRRRARGRERPDRRPQPELIARPRKATVAGEHLLPADLRQPAELVPAGAVRRRPARPARLRHRLRRLRQRRQAASRRPRLARRRRGALRDRRRTSRATSSSWR